MPIGFTAVSLNALAKPAVVEELSYEAILARMKADGVARLNELGIAYNVQNLESDPAVKFLEVAAYSELLLRQRVNDAVRAVLLAYAHGADLDHRGVDFETPRMVMGTDPDTGAPIMEDDERYRRRLQLAPEAFATTGSRGAYIFHALSSDPSIADAWAYCPKGPADGRVDVILAGFNGAPVTDAIIAKLATRLEREDVRPLTDTVVVRRAQRVDYVATVSAQLQFGFDPATIKAEIEKRIRGYAADRYRIGAEVYRPGITASAFVAGVETLAIAGPASDVVCSDEQIPYMTGLTVTIIAD
jgi:phage-related baseplate assembly protein